MDSSEYKKHYLKLSRILEKYPIVGSHGTNSFSLEQILKKGLIRLSDENIGFTGENLLKPNRSSEQYVSVSVNKDQNEIYPYYLTIGLYYAERVSKHEVLNRNDYLTDHLIKKFVISSEGGFEEYSKKILIRKYGSYSEEELKNYINETKNKFNYLESDNSYNKYYFSLERINTFEKATVALLDDKSKIQTILLSTKPVSFSSFEYYLRELCRVVKKQYQKGNLQEVDEILQSRLFRIKKIEEIYNTLGEGQKNKLENSYPVVILFNLENVELCTTTSSVLCERLTEYLEPERIIAVFTYIESQPTPVDFPIDFLYRLESEKIDKIQAPFFNVDLTNFSCM